jgi:hypothetical protein
MFRRGMLSKARILIVDGQRPVASHLAHLIKKLDGEVIGPVASIADAQLILSRDVDIDGALLDSELPDGRINPVAFKLLDESVPIVIHSEAGIPHTLKFFYPKLASITKPGAVKAVATLTRLVCERLSRFPKPTRKKRSPIAPFGS